MACAPLFPAPVLLALGLGECSNRANVARNGRAGNGDKLLRMRTTAYPDLNGSRTVKQLPRAGVLSTVMLPWCFSMMP